MAIVILYDPSYDEDPETILYPKIEQKINFT